MYVPTLLHFPKTVVKPQLVLERGPDSHSGSGALQNCA